MAFRMRKRELRLQRQPPGLSLQHRRGDSARIAAVLQKKTCYCSYKRCFSSIDKAHQEVLEVVQAFASCHVFVQDQLLSEAVANLAPGGSILVCGEMMGPACFRALFMIGHVRYRKRCKGFLDGRSKSGRVRVYPAPKRTHVRQWLVKKYCAVADHLPNRMYKRTEQRKKRRGCRAQMHDHDDNSSSQADDSDDPATEDKAIRTICHACKYSNLKHECIRE